MKKISVVNTKRDICTHYCGRKQNYTGNGKDFSALSNPFHLAKEEDRANVILQYRRYAWQQLKDEDSEFSKAIWVLTEESKEIDISLGFFCFPLDCHADVIKSIIIWKNEK